MSLSGDGVARPSYAIVYRICIAHGTISWDLIFRNMITKPP